MSRLKCPVCTFGCNDQESWMNHLISNGHRASQLVHLLWNWPLQKNQRALVIESPMLSQEQLDDEEGSDVKVDVHFFYEALAQFFDLTRHPEDIQDFYIDYRWNLAVLLLAHGGEAMELLKKAKMTPFFESSQIMLKSMYFLEIEKFDSLEKIRLGQPGTEETPEDSCFLDLKKTFQTIRRSPLNLNQQLLYLLECYAVTMSDIDLQQVVFDDLKSIFAKKFTQSSLILVEGAGSHFGYKFRPINVHAFVDLMLNGFETINDLRRAVSNILVGSESFVLVKDLTWRKNNPDFTILQFRHTSLNILIALKICARICEKNQRLWDQTLMAYLISFDKRALALTNFILLWNNQQKLGVPVLVIITLVLVFLMKKGVIPSVRLLQDLQPLGKRDVRNGWDFSLCTDTKLIQKRFNGLPEIIPENGDSLYDAKDVLLWTREMFSWLTERRLENSVVSIFAADIIPRECFLPGGLNKMPEGLMKKYLITPDGCLRTNEDQKLNVDPHLPVIIQDPFVLSKNIAQMGRGRVRRFQKWCEDSLAKIDKALREANLLLVFTGDFENQALTPLNDRHSEEFYLRATMLSSSPQRAPEDRGFFTAEPNSCASAFTIIDINSCEEEELEEGELEEGELEEPISFHSGKSNSPDNYCVELFGIEKALAPQEKTSKESQCISTTASQPFITIRADLCTPPASPIPESIDALDIDLQPLPSSSCISRVTNFGAKVSVPSASGGSKTRSPIRKGPSKRCWTEKDVNPLQERSFKRDDGTSIDNCSLLMSPEPKRARPNISTSGNNSSQTNMSWKPSKPSISNKNEKAVTPVNPVPKHCIPRGDPGRQKFSRYGFVPSKTLNNVIARSRPFMHHSSIPNRPTNNNQNNKSVNDIPAQLKELLTKQIDIDQEKRYIHENSLRKVNTNSHSCNTFSYQSGIQHLSTQSKYEKALNRQAPLEGLQTHIYEADSLIKFDDKSWFDISAPDFMDIIMKATEKYRKNKEEDRMKAKNLWLSFMKDFFTDVWSYCFGIEAGVAIKREKNDEWIKDLHSSSVSGDEPIWLRKWNKIPQSEETFYRMWKMKAATCFWTNRDDLTESMGKSVQGYDEMDPLIFEKSITELCPLERVIQDAPIAISRSAWGVTPDILAQLPLRSVPEFWCEVKLRTTNNTATVKPRANHFYYFAFRPSNRPPSVQTQQAILCLNKVLKKLIPRYAKRRLQTWLQTSL